MGDKVRKCILIALSLGAVYLGGNGSFAVLQLLFDASRQADPTNGLFVAKNFAGALGAVVTAIFYQFVGHNVISKVVAAIAAWWGGSNLDPRASDLLELTVIAGLKQRRPGNSEFHELVDDLDKYCRDNPTAAPDLSPALRAAKQLAKS